VEGVFPSEPIIKRQERASAKFLSAEQEAEERKREILALSSSAKTSTVAAESEPEGETETEIVRTAQTSEASTEVLATKTLVAEEASKISSSSDVGVDNRTVRRNPFSDCMC
jgi:hypothetical protein